MKNLLQETINILKEHGKSLENDVLWIGDNSSIISVADFKKYADFEYDPGYGLHYVNLGLVIVGTDFWLSRREYDGAEYWIFNQKPVMPKISQITEVWENYFYDHYQVKKPKYIIEQEWARNKVHENEEKKENAKFMASPKDEKFCPFAGLLGEKK